MLKDQLLSPAQVTEIYQKHMQQDFPPAERKPLQVLLDSMAKGLYLPYGWFNEAEELVAYTFFVQTPQGQVLLLDYFAVCSAYRNSGYGSQCLAQMKTLHPEIDGILAEVEDPATSSSAEEAVTRTRRVAFYQRNGLRQTKVYSILFGVPYLMHYLPIGCDCSDEQLLEALEQLYHTLFPPSIYQAHAKIWLTGNEA